MQTISRSKWFLPGLSVALGGVVFVAQWVGGNHRSAVFSLALMTGVGLVVLLGGRSETIRGLRGDGRDERFRQIDLTATALAGSSAVTAILIAFVVDLARGNDGMPYAWLGAIAGLTYIVAVIALRIRG